MPSPAVKTGDILSFGPFALSVSERLLTKGGESLHLSARAVDILIALVSNSSQPLSKRELMARVWPDATVGENSLRFHISNLRKVLGDGEGGARYITTLPGRGYCFVAPISRASEGSKKEVTPVTVRSSGNLPPRLSRMVGRADTIDTLSKQLAASRFVTIVGPGGVGKTTVAVAVAHELMTSFAGAVLFVDFGVLSDPDLVSLCHEFPHSHSARIMAGHLTSLLGLSVPTDDSLAGLIAYLRDKRMLLILDTCEHFIESAAGLAAHIYAAAPQVHILATSREALRVEGERVYKLPTLACPPDDPKVTGSALHSFPATQLFLERVAATGTHLNLGDQEAALVVDICRKLDGIALAIELAAGRVEAYGLQQTAALLEQSLMALRQGQRTAPPRQRTLQATLDWSYRLLSDHERLILRRLAVFVGDFDIHAALAIATSVTVDQALVLSAIDSLVAKSMVAANQAGARMQYRLLDTTRSYALEFSVDRDDRENLAARHADYYRRWLEQVGTETRPALLDVEERMRLFAGLNNVRAALEWCFGANGNSEIGVCLAATAVPVFLSMSLFRECGLWSERAILALHPNARGKREEMQLQAAVGMSLMFSRGNNTTVRSAFGRSLAIAEQQGDILDQLKLLAPLHVFHVRMGEFKTALRYAEQMRALSERVEDSASAALGRGLLGYSLHFAGELGRARTELEAALRQSFGERDYEHRPSEMHATKAQPLSAPILTMASSMTTGALARTLWLQGHPTEARWHARQNAKHPVTVLYAVSVFLWIGDFDAAEEYIGRLISYAETHSLEPYVAVGRGFRGQLAVFRGAASDGVHNLRDCLKAVHAAKYEVLTTPFNISLVQGLVAMGQLNEGLSLIDETMDLVELNGDLVYQPELFRVKGSLLLSMRPPRGDEARACFIQSLDLSRRQGARAWELRAATDLAKLLADGGKRHDAHSLLRPIFDSFTEGQGTADMKAAKQLLASLR